MAMSTIIRSRSATFVGVFFTAVTAYVLLEDCFRHGAPFTTKHLMTLAVLGGTVYFGHVLWRELRVWRIGTAIGCTVLFLGGTTACVLMSAGRNAEVVTNKALAANSDNGTRQRAEMDRNEAKARYQAALAAETEECNSGTGGKCLAKRATAVLRRGDLDAAEHWLAAQQPPRVANADIRAAAELISRLPYVTANVSAVEALLQLAFPFLQSLFCEVGAIVGFSIGLGHRALPAARPAKCANSAVRQAPVRELTPSRTHEFRGGTPKADALKDLLSYIATHGIVPSQDFLRERWKLRSRGTVSDWLSEWQEAGLVNRHREGRFKVTSSRTSRTAH